MIQVKHLVQPLLSATFFGCMLLNMRLILDSYNNAKNEISVGLVANSGIINQAQWRSENVKESAKAVKRVRQVLISKQD